MVADARMDRAAANLRLDALTAEVVTALRDEGVRPLLLKGPSIARWLYDGAGERPYVDVDLLVAPGELRAAERALTRIGFRAGEWLAWLRRARAWERADGAVDLHTSLFGVNVSPADAWAILSGETDTLVVGGVQVEALAIPARAFHVAAHAAQHPPSHMHTRAREDLGRAVARLPRETWDAVAAVARELRAEPALAAGLSQVDDGARLAEELGVEVAGAADVALHVEDAPWTALGFAQIAAADSMRLRLTLLARAIVPPAALMRTYSSLAARGTAGLALAYVTRAGRLAWAAPGGFAQWRRARR